jgi:hypothetical protein
MVRSKFSVTCLRLALTVAVLTATSVAYAQQGEDLREAAQNPIADFDQSPLSEYFPNALTLAVSTFGAAYQRRWRVIV